MSHDLHYTKNFYKVSEIKHHYGENIHILEDPYLMSILAKISAPETHQPLLTNYVKKAYLHLFKEIIANSFETELSTTTTRMSEFCKEGIYQSKIIKSDTKAVCVDLARAGMIPSQLFYEELNYLLLPNNIRQDHFYAARIVNDLNEVIGVDISGSKIGGDIDNAYVLLPDPMGATGGTICEAINYYKEHIEGRAKKFIVAHLIITPEYIQKIQNHHPDIEVYAIRLDRGLSSEKALNAIPGEFIKEEKGLNDHQYIVPGAGGVGELLNNSFV